MNKEVIHSGAFLSRAGVAWKIKIWRMTTDIPVGDDDPDDLEFPAEEPIVIEWDEKAKEEPLCGSCATVRIISPGDRTYAGLYTIEAGSIGCDIYRKGRSDNDYTRYWSGTLDTEQYEEPYERAWGYDVVLTFQDFGIFGRLKYDLEGMQTLQSILTDALQRARLDHVTLDASTYISSRHIEMEQASAVASSEMDYGEGILITDDKPTKWVVGELVPTIDPYLEPIIVGPDTVAANSCNFYDDDGEGLPIADVLTAIMQPFGLRMTQRAGKIWLYDLNALAATPDEITCSTPEKSLLRPLRGTGGRNNQGKMTMRYLGGGHKKMYRVIDFLRDKDNYTAVVKTIEYDPNRSARIALVVYGDGEKLYHRSQRNQGRTDHCFRQRCRS